MRQARIAGNVLLAVYLWITGCAFLLTVLNLPLYLPRAAVLYAYGMMAPYRSHDTAHVELLAEGRRSDGGWERIDLSPYYPVLFGEMSVRTHAAMFAAGGSWRDDYARRLLALERDAGHAYDAIRFSWKIWPNQTGPYHHNDLPYITRVLPLGVFQ